MLKIITSFLLLGCALSMFSFDAAGQTKKVVRRKPKTAARKQIAKPKPNPLPAIRLPSINDQPLARGLEILQQANRAHGAAALNDLKTVRMTGRMRVNNDFYDYKILIDVARNRVREETRGRDADYFYVSQAENESGWVFAAAEKREMDESERRDLQKVLRTGWLGLRADALKDVRLSIVEVDERKKRATLRGATSGETYSRVFDRENLLIAESLMYQPEENLDLYDDFRKVAGITIPHRKTSLFKSLLIIVEWSKIEVNPDLTEQDWAVPR